MALSSHSCGHYGKVDVIVASWNLLAGDFRFLIPISPLIGYSVCDGA